MTTNKIEIIDASVRTKRSQNIKRQAGSNESSAEAVKRTANPAKKNTARRKEPENKIPSSKKSNKRQQKQSTKTTTTPY